MYLKENEVNYIIALLNRDAIERGNTDVASWVKCLAEKIKEAN